MTTDRITRYHTQYTYILIKINNIIYITRWLYNITQDELCACAILSDDVSAYILFLFIIQRLFAMCRIIKRLYNRRSGPPRKDRKGRVVRLLYYNSYVLNVYIYYTPSHTHTHSIGRQDNWRGTIYYYYYTHILYTYSMYIYII